MMLGPSIRRKLVCQIIRQDGIAHNHSLCAHTSLEHLLLEGNCPAITELLLLGCVPGRLWMSMESMNPSFVLMMRSMSRCTDHPLACCLPPPASCCCNCSVTIETVGWATTKLATLALALGPTLALALGPVLRGLPIANAPTERSRDDDACSGGGT